MTCFVVGGSLFLLVGCSLCLLFVPWIEIQLWLLTLCLSLCRAGKIKNEILYLDARAKMKEDEERRDRKLCVDAGGGHVLLCFASRLENGDASSWRYEYE